MNINENSIRVLLIEDNPGDVRLIKEMLQETKGRKITLEHCATLTQGLQALLKNDFNILILDLTLPDSTGFDTFVKVYTQNPQIPIVVLTGTNDEELAIKSVRTGAQDYLIKGQIDSSLLSRSISYAIERAGLLRVVQQELIERKAMESTLRKINRALRVLGECNEIVVRAKEEKILVEMICGAITTLGEYQFAWVAIADPNNNISIQPIAIAGSKDGNSPVDASAWFKRDADSRLSEALKTGKVVVCNDVTIDKRCTNLKTEADKLGYRSFVILPLVTGGKTLGVVQICSREPDRFDREELKLLDELKEDIAYAIVSIRTEKERRRAEEALRCEQMMLARTEGVAHVGSWEWYIATDTVTWSNELFRIFQRDPREGAPSFAEHPAFYHPDDMARLQQAVEAAVADGTPYELELRAIRKDGETRVCVACGMAEKEPGGRPFRLFGSLQDITERKRAEEALRESEERYRMLFEGAAEGILVADIESKQFKYSNPAVCKMFGYTADEMLELGIADIHPKEAFDNVTAEFDAQASNKKIVSSEIPCLRKDGSIFYAIIATTPIIINGRKCNVGFFTDITERKEAEEKLRETRDYLENLLSFANAPIMVWDSNFRVTRFNVAFERLTGYSMYEVIGKHPEMFFPADTQEASLALIRQTTGGSHLVSAEIPVCCKDGSIRIVLWNSANIYAADDQTIIATIAHGLDITERKRAEEERNKLQAELIQSQKMKSIGTLAGGIAHDFNNILGIILGYTSLLEKRRSDDKMHAEGIATINQAVQRGAALVRQILTFARKTDIEFEPFDLTDLIHELISMLRQTFPRLISFTVNVEKDIPYMYADRTQVHQVLLNLCINARDAMPNGGCITVKVEKQSLELVQERFAAANQNSYLCISITDTGEGMDEATRIRVFDPFFTTKENGKGTGMGLSVVYGVVQTHHGFIDLESEAGHGTTFRLYFPIPVIGEQMVKSQQPPESFDIGGTETILIVEDEELLIELVRFMLESKGYKVYSARDGREAIEVYKQHKKEIALVLTDMGLPEITGADEFKRLKEIDPQVKVIFASGFFNPDTKSELLQIGAKGFIQKPYETNDILRTVREVLDKK